MVNYVCCLYFSFLIYLYTFYLRNFNILGIVQFKFNSPIYLLHLLSKITCLNRLILIEYKKNEIFWLPQIYIRQTHILAGSRKPTFWISAYFSP